MKKVKKIQTYLLFDLFSKKAKEKIKEEEEEGVCDLVSL